MSFIQENNSKGNQLKNSMNFSANSLLSLNCNLGCHKESNIRDVFIANMLDGEFQSKLLKERIPSKKDLKVDNNTEMAIKNQLKLSITFVYTVSCFDSLAIYDNHDLFHKNCIENLHRSR